VCSPLRKGWAVQLWWGRVLHDPSSSLLDNCARKRVAGPSPTLLPLAGMLLLAAAWPLVRIREDTVEDKGPIRRTREGGSEWEPIKNLLEGDENSNKLNTASNTRLQLTTQVGQAHIATGVPLDLGTNTQPSDPRTQRNTKPRVYRPTPVRPVSTTGQTGPCW
jgi:hypothetical protein